MNRRAWLVLAVAAGLVAGCGQNDQQNHLRRVASVSRIGALRAGDDVWTSPAPLGAPGDYNWADRARFERDVHRHLYDLERQIRVLKTGLRTGAGPIPSEYLADIRTARQGVAEALARLAEPNAAEWDLIRLQVHHAIDALDRAVVRARHSGSPVRRAAPL